jgi:hypothetical protein
MIESSLRDLFQTRLHLRQRRQHQLLETTSDTADVDVEYTFEALHPSHRCSPGDDPQKEHCDSLKAANKYWGHLKRVAG